MNGLVFGSIKSDYLQSDQRKLSRYSNLLENVVPRPSLLLRRCIFHFEIRMYTS